MPGGRGSDKAGHSASAASSHSTGTGGLGHARSNRGIGHRGGPRTPSFSGDSQYKADVSAAEEAYSKAARFSNERARERARDARRNALNKAARDASARASESARHASMGDLDSKFGGHDYGKTTNDHHDGGGSKTGESTSTGETGGGFGVGTGTDAAHGGMGAGAFGGLSLGGDSHAGQGPAHGGFGGGAFSGTSFGGGSRVHSSGGIAGTGHSWGSIGVGDYGSFGNEVSNRIEAQGGFSNKYGFYDIDTLQTMYHSQLAQEAADRAWESGDYLDYAANKLSAWGNSMLGATSRQVDSFGNDPLDYSIDFTRTLPGKMLLGGLTGMTGLTIAGAAQLAQDAYGYSTGDLTKQEALGQALGDVGATIGGIQGYVAAQASRAVKGEYGAVAGSMTGQMVGKMAANALSGLDPMANALASNMVSGAVGTAVKNTVDANASSINTSNPAGGLGEGYGTGGRSETNTVATGMSGYNPESVELANVGNVQQYSQGFQSQQDTYDIANLQAKQAASNVFGNNAYGFLGDNAYGLESYNSPYVLWGNI